MKDNEIALLIYDIIGFGTDSHDNNEFKIVSVLHKAQKTIFCAQMNAKDFACVHSHSMIRSRGDGRFGLSPEC